MYVDGPRQSIAEKGSYVTGNRGVGGGRRDGTACPEAKGLLETKVSDTKLAGGSRSGLFQTPNTEKGGPWDFGRNVRAFLLEILQYHEICGIMTGTKRGGNEE